MKHIIIISKIERKKLKTPKSNSDFYLKCLCHSQQNWSYGVYTLQLEGNNWWI